MKQILLVASALLMTGTFSWAETVPAASSGTVASMSEACKDVENACLKAGFDKRDSIDGKRLYADCMMPVTKGQVVEGVTVEQASILSCREKMFPRRIKPIKSK